MVPLIFLCAPAIAQSVQQPTSTQVEEDSPADEQIIVTGIRASLERAQDVKRRSTTVVEAITAEDLGRFTDPSLATALQRVPGVQVDRNARSRSGGQSGVTIRGLGSGFVITTLNGRNALGQGAARSIDFDSLPPEVIAGVVVYKTPSAGLVESGLAGEVDIQTLKPLDFRSPRGGATFGSIAVQGNYAENREKLSPRISGVIGGKLFDDTLGFYVAGVYSDEYFREKQLYNFGSPIDVSLQQADGSVTSYSGIWAVVETDSLQADINYRRRAVSSGLQWRPESNLEINIEGMFSKYTTDLRESTYQNYTGYSLNGVTFSADGAEIREGALVRYDTSKAVCTSGTCPTDGSSAFPYGGGNGGIVGGKDINRNLNWLVGANVRYEVGDTINISADYAHSYNNYRQDLANGYWISSGAAVDAINGSYDFSGTTPNYSYYGSNTPSNLSLYSTAASGANGLGYYYEQAENIAKRDQFRFDIGWEASSWLTLHAGVRREETSIQRVFARGSNVFDYFSDPNDPNSGYYSTDGFLTGDTIDLLGVGSIAQATYDNFADTNGSVTSLSNFGRGSFRNFPETSAGDPEDELDFDPGGSYRIFEKTNAVYVQADGEGDAFGLPVSGNVGVRAIRVTEDTVGFQDVSERLSLSNELVSSRSERVTGNNEYTKVLPSANVLVQPSEAVNVRLSYAKTMTLPGYGSLRPNGSVTIKLPNGNIQEENDFNGGNTNLNPTIADNFDLTVEYYTSYGGAVIVSAFHKDVRDFITSFFQSQVPISGQVGLYNSSTDVNAGEGYTQGFEIGTNQPFTFLPAPWDGFGVSANYTYVDSEQTLASTSGDIVSALPGTSRDNVNGTIYYERNGFGARLAYSYRSDYVTGVGNVLYNDVVVNRTYVRGFDMLDASLSKEFGQFEVIATVSNLTAAKQISYWGDAKVLQAISPFPTSYALSLRMAF